MTAEEQALHAKLKGRLWRLNNLYWIEDKRGRKVKFRLNWAQRAFLAAMHWLNVILKARQLGMSTLMAIYMLDTCLFGRNKTCGIIDKTDPDAKKKLNKMKFAYDNLDCEDRCSGANTAALGAMIKGDVRLIADNGHELKFSNESKIWAGTSLRGGTLQILHVSELGYIAANFPKKAEESRSGAFNTVDQGCVIVIESTHEGGKTGLNYEMIVTAQESPADPSPLDWRFHFYAWWQDTEYSLANPKPVTDEKMLQYFAQLEEQHGISLTPGQQAWYAGKARTQKAAMKKEYPSTPEEAVNAVIKGAIYGEQISQMRAAGRICEFNLQPGMPIYCPWDIGVSDFVDLWFVQPVGMQHLVFDFYENSGYGVAHYVEYVRAWEKKHGVTITLHILPHDAGHRQFGVSDSNGKSMSVIQQLYTMGITNAVVVSRTSDVWIGINQLRAMMPNMVFHKTNCQKDRVKDGRRYPSGIGALESYRKADDSNTTILKEAPLHDDNSHASDALRAYAEGFAAGMISPHAFNEPGKKKSVTVHTGSKRELTDDEIDFPIVTATKPNFRKIRVKK
ncbi:MAG: hypothetical protein JWO82_3765 [Akkermansiaceae bacterium]|nr:hypothetical protein [Akkermansiaceae bacterium]